MTPEEQQAMLMQVMGAHEGPGPVNANFADPEQALLGTFQRRFNLSPEEVQQIQVQGPGEGLTLRQRLERLRPDLNVGGMELSVDGSIEEPRIEGRMRF